MCCCFWDQGRHSGRWDRRGRTPDRVERAGARIIRIPIELADKLLTAGERATLYGMLSRAVEALAPACEPARCAAPEPDDCLGPEDDTLSG